MSESVARFYNHLADAYRYIFPDWHTSVRRQGNIINAIFNTHGFRSEQHTLYDCTCGIGTQVFGLAELGWEIHGSDLSSNAIANAQAYTPEFDTPIMPTFAVADLLDPTEQNRTQYDVVIAMDNAVPHFMTDDDLLRALQTMEAHMTERGALFISIRDYDALLENPPRTTLPSISDTEDGRYIIFQTWDWAEDLASYQLNMYITHHVGDTVTTQCFPSEYRALRREQLSDSLKKVGLSDIKWLMPEESGYYQPIVIARKI